MPGPPGVDADDPDPTFLIPGPKGDTGAAGAGGAGNAGTATLDFGAWPGKTDASVAVTGQGAIVAGSVARAWIRPVATAEHSADEHILAQGSLGIVAGNIVAGTGFTIYGVCTEPDRQPPAGLPANGNFRTAAAKGPRLYGDFTVAWSWQ